MRSGASWLTRRASSLAVEHGSAVLIEAPAGFGKTTVMRQIAERLDVAVHVVAPDDLGALAEIIRSYPHPVHVLIDVPSADPAAIATVADDPNTAALYIADRVISRDIRRTLERFDCLELDASALRASPEEVQRLLGEACDAAIADLVVDFTGGWLAAVQEIKSYLDGLSHRARESDVQEATTSARLRSFLEHVLSSVPDDVQTALRAYGRLERFTSDALEEVTSRGFLERAVRSGAPITLRADGWFEVPPILREHIRRTTSKDQEIGRIAPALVRSGGLIAALRVLVMAGALDAARHTLLEAPASDVDEAEQRALLGVVNLIDPAHADLRLGLVRARAHENLGEINHQLEVLEHLEELAAGREPPEGEHPWTDIRLEVARARALRGAVVNEAIRRLGVRTTTPAQRTQMAEVVGIEQSQSAQPSEVEVATRTLWDVAEQWQMQGEYARAASVLRILASAPLGHLGLHADAVDALRRARRLSATRFRDRAMTTNLMCRVAALAGDVELAERSIAECRSLSRAINLPWLELYLNWSEMHCAALRGLAGRTAELAGRAVGALGELERHSTAVVLYSEAASALALVGNTALAEEYLERAQARESENPIEVAVAAVTVAARAGQVELAQGRAGEACAHPRMPKTRMWRPALEVAVARVRAGLEEPESLAPFIAAAEPLRLEALADQLTRTDEGEASRTRVRVLGEFNVLTQGRPSPTPNGHPTTLLKILATSGGSVAVDRVSDWLWPDASEDVARKRLKNVVNRLRNALDADCLVREHDALSLGPLVETDIEEFTASADRAASTADPGERVAAATYALNLYRGQLLPADLYADWAAARRTEVAAAAISAVDVLLADQDGLRPSASWLLAAVLRIDPLDEARLIEVGKIALQEGDTSTARRALLCGRQAAEELEFEASASLVHLEAQLATA